MPFKPFPKKAGASDKSRKGDKPNPFGKKKAPPYQPDQVGQPKKTRRSPF